MRMPAQLPRNITHLSNVPGPLFQRPPPPQNQAHPGKAEWAGYERLQPLGPAHVCGRPLWTGRPQALMSWHTGHSPEQDLWVPMQGMISSSHSQQAEEELTDLLASMPWDRGEPRPHRDEEGATGFLLRPPGGSCHSELFHAKASSKLLLLFHLHDKPRGSPCHNGRKLRHRGTQSAQDTQLSDQVGLSPKTGEGRFPHRSTSHCIDGAHLFTAVAEGEEAGLLVSILQQPKHTSSHVQLNRPNNSTQPYHREPPHAKLGGLSPL